MSSATSTADLTLPTTLLRPWPLLARLTAQLAGDDMLQKSLLSIADQAVVSATNFAITVVIGRLCGKPEVGLYYLALQLVFFARGLQEQLIASPYMVYGGRRQGPGAATFAGSTLIHELLLLVAVSGGLLLVGAFAGFSPALSEIIWLLVGAAPLMLLREFARQISFAQLRVKEALAVDCGVALLQLGAIGVAAYAGVLSTSLTYVILSLGCGVATIAWLAWRPGQFLAKRESIWPDWVHNWRFGRWALASQLLGQTMPYLLPWIVAGTHGQAATGVLGVGTTFIGFANMFVLGLSNFVCPQAAQAYAAGGARDLQKVLSRAIVMHLSVLVPFALMILFFGSPLMAFIYGPDFADAGTIMVVLALGAIANSLGIVSGNGLWAMEMPSANFRADLCALIVWLVASALLIPTCGPLGAAIASVAGTTAGAAVRALVLVTELRRSR